MNVQGHAQQAQKQRGASKDKHDLLRAARHDPVVRKVR